MIQQQISIYYLYCTGTKMYMLNSMVLNLKTEQEGKKGVLSANFRVINNKKTQRFLPEVFLSP